jgi:ribonuclease P protein component
MFSKKQRLSFKGKLPKNVLNSPSFTLKYGASDEGLKVAVAVSKKVDKRAVVRNKIKRKFRELIKKQLGKNDPLSLIFYIKKTALQNTDIEKETESVISKIRN